MVGCRAAALGEFLEFLFTLKMTLPEAPVGFSLHRAVFSIQ
jgi:hypothetical protein